MNERIRKLIRTKSAILFPGTDTVDCQIDDIEKFAELIVKECIDCCDEVAADADAMKDSKFVTDSGRMLHEGMWGGATNSAITIKNRFGVKE